MSEQEVTQPEDSGDLLFTLLTNVIALNLFVQTQFGEQGAQILEQLEEQVRITMQGEGQVEN